MERLQREVRRARRRLVLQRFFEVLPWCGFAALWVAVVLLTIERFYPIGLSMPWTIGSAIAVAAGLALLWVGVRRQTPLDAALEIDRRFELRERVSSSLSLAQTEQETSAGQALVKDTISRIERIDVGERFAIRPSRWSWLPLVPAAAVFLVLLVPGPAATGKKVQAKTDSDQVRKQISTSGKTLQKRINEVKKKAEQAGLKDVEELLGKIEKGAEKDLVSADNPDRKRALIKLNDLARELEKRQSELGGAERIHKQLEKLRDLPKGPGERFAGALKSGKFGQAAKELQKLREKLAKGELSEEQKKQLAEQLSRMQKELAQLAEAHQRSMKDMQRRIDEKRAAGQHAEARRLEEELAKLKQMAPQMRKLERLADAMQQCSQCMQGGDAEGASDALSQLAAELDGMQQQIDEWELMESALDEFAQAKNSMNCKSCGGKGCGHCQGNGEGLGDGLGRGRGIGHRPEKEHETGDYASRVKQRPGRGSAVMTDLVDGPNAKGQVEAEIRSQLELVTQQSAEPLTDQKLPRKVRDHTKEYFDSLREGE